MRPLISICVPNLNKCPFLAERMDTLLAQSCRDWELIVCDSYSDDGSWELLQTYRRDPRVHLHRVPRAGLYAGWNECLRRCTGRFIIIATSDDTSAPEQLERLVEPLLARPEAQVAVCGYRRIDEHGGDFRETAPDRGREFIEKYAGYRSIRSGAAEFLLHACFTTVWETMAGVMFSREVLDRAGPFRTDLGTVADCEWSYRAALGTSVAFVPEVLAGFRIYASQATDWRGGPRMSRQRLDALWSVLSDPKIEVPERWRRVPRWRERIAAALTMELHDSFGLHRGKLRTAPREFAQSVLLAARLAPMFLLSQMLRGFRWTRERFNPDYERIALDLLADFDVPWPPAPAGADWR
jgi:glycosyltransferase involved in cell wall biosynthesis